MLQWLKQNNVLEVIFGDNAHTEIVKRANVLLQFYAKQSKGYLDQDIIDLTWKCQDGKHEEMVRCIQKLIIQVLPCVQLQVCDNYFTKIQQEKKFDEKFLNFLNAFTVHSLEKQYETLEARYDDVEQDDEQMQQDDFDTYLSKTEDQQIHTISQSLQINNPPLHKQYGMPIFWQICLDENNLPKETRDRALDFLMKMFGRNFRKVNRIYYLTLALKELLASK